MHITARKVGQGVVAPPYQFSTTTDKPAAFTLGNPEAIPNSQPRNRLFRGGFGITDNPAADIADSTGSLGSVDSSGADSAADSASPSDSSPGVAGGGKGSKGSKGGWGVEGVTIGAEIAIGCSKVSVDVDIGPQGGSSGGSSDDSSPQGVDPQ